jgi:hypothetical protein
VSATPIDVALVTALAVTGVVATVLARIEHRRAHDSMHGAPVAIGAIVAGSGSVRGFVRAIGEPLTTTGGVRAVLVRTVVACAFAQDDRESSSEVVVDRTVAVPATLSDETGQCTIAAAAVLLDGPATTTTHSAEAFEAAHADLWTKVVGASGGRAVRSVAMHETIVADGALVCVGADVERDDGGATLRGSLARPMWIAVGDGAAPRELASGAVRTLAIVALVAFGAALALAGAVAFADTLARDAQRDDAQTRELTTKGQLSSGSHCVLKSQSRSGRALHSPHGEVRLALQPFG